MVFIFVIWKWLLYPKHASVFYTYEWENSRVKRTQELGQENWLIQQLSLKSHSMNSAYISTQKFVIMDTCKETRKVCFVLFCFVFTRYTASLSKWGRRKEKSSNISTQWSCIQQTYPVLNFKYHLWECVVICTSCFVIF